MRHPSHIAVIIILVRKKLLTIETRYQADSKCLWFATCRSIAVAAHNAIAKLVIWGDEPALATRNHMGLNKHHGLVTIMIVIVIIDKMVMIVRRHAPVACRHRIRRGRVLFSVGRGDASAESGLQ